MTITIDRQFTTFEAAKICRVFPTTVINWANKGMLKASTTPGGHRRISAADLVEFMERVGMVVPENLMVRPKRVLVVEDDTAFLDLLQRSLETLPCVEVATQTDGFMALLGMGHNPPDLLVLDINLPGMDGIKVCQVLKSGELTKFVKVVAISGNALVAESPEFLAAKCDGFLQKPFPMSELKDLAAELLELEPEASGSSR